MRVRKDNENENEERWWECEEIMRMRRDNENEKR